MRAFASRVPAGRREVWEGTFVFRANSVCSFTMGAQRTAKKVNDAAGVPAPCSPSRAAVPPRRAPRAGVRPAPKRKRSPLFTSASQEWYTPPEVVALVQGFLGGIDLDPCSNSHEQPWVPALRHFTKEDDGLAHSWSGKVFVNPPYHDAEKWVRKLLAEHASGRVTEALLLVPARPDTVWSSLLRDLPRCYLKGRLKFIPGDAVPEKKRKNGATAGSALYYLGGYPEHFADVFGRGPDRLGDVFVRVK